eukprot:GABV01006895.1.p1 GENE.GABV01006895.1~~GABV01006895.1.p1  ORF type:complete len:113 (-),score=50.52 GABV01006895.1:11-304(-)
MKVGTATLKQLQQDWGLESDKVGDAMDELAEVIAEGEDVETALTQPVTVDTWEEADLEKELEELTALDELEKLERPATVTARAPTIVPEAKETKIQH